MRGALFGIGILSISHVLLVIWRYEIILFSLIWPILLISIGVIILVISELLGHELTRLIELITISHRYALGFLILVAVLANLTLIGPGYIHADGLGHAFRVWYLRKAWLNGTFYPIWCPYWYSGHPMFEFYGILFYIFAAVLSLFSDWMTGSKLALYIACILSPMAMYGLIYVITEDRLGGVIGGLAYTLSYYKFGLITKFGHLPSSPVLVFIPLLFLFLEIAIKREDHIFAVLAGFCFAGIFLSHPGEAYMVTFLVIFYLLTSCAFKFNFKNIFFILQLAVITAGVALGLSSFFLIPFVLDGFEADASVFIHPGKLGDPISLPLILTRDFIRINRPFPVYVGNSILLLAFAAIFLRRNRASIVYTASLLFSFFFVISSVFPFYSELPLILSLDWFPYRFLLLVSFVASILTGITVSSIKDIQKPLSLYLKKLKLSPRLQKRIIIVLMIIIIIDLWPGTLVSKNRPLEWFIDDNWQNAYYWLNEKPGYYKVYQIIDGPSSAVFPAVAGNKFAQVGYYRQSENRYYGEFTTLFKREIRNLESSPREGLANPLRLLGVKYVLLDMSKSYAKHLKELPDLKIVQTFGSVYILEYSEYSSPVIISRSAELLGGDREIETFYTSVTNANYDPSEKIFIKEKQYYSDVKLPLNISRDSMVESGGNSYVLELEVKENTIFAKVYTSTPSFIFFSFNFFPGWKAYLNGNESKILIAEPYFMCLYIENVGTHEISLEYHINTPKTIGVIITTITLLITLFVMFLSSQNTIKEIVEKISSGQRKRKIRERNSR